jgi:aryl-alcohol dehydrogenase-like predicted oxidoreductase
MKYRTLPGTGINVSNLALRTMGFGTETAEADAFAILDRFVEADGNLVDTSNVYGAGASEELLGRWFASRPADVTERVVLATKARFGTGPDTNENGSSRRNLDRALTASLRRPQRDQVDLDQLHAWDPLTPIEVTLSFLDDAVHAGKIHHIGLSNFTAWQLQLTVDTAKAMPAGASDAATAVQPGLPASWSSKSSRPHCTTTSACCPDRRSPGVRQRQVPPRPEGQERYPRGIRRGHV